LDLLRKVWILGYRESGED